jgi:exopolyphosphatase/pppGpp-phosphohydrolase
VYVRVSKWGCRSGIILTGITQEQETRNISESFLAGKCAEEEAIIQSASYRVEQAKLMRELAQKRAQEAKEDHDNNVRHANKRCFSVCDYAQNLGIPNFGSDQPGDT